MSRLIVKNLPAYVDDAQVRKHFTQTSKPSVSKPGQPSTTVPLNLTDVRLARRPDGKSRCFAFLGYKTNEEAAAARSYFDRTYVGGSRISVEIVDSTKPQEPSKKRSRTSQQDSLLFSSTRVANADSSTSGDKATTPVKSSKVQNEFLRAFAPRTKGRSWLDGDTEDVPVVASSALEPDTPSSDVVPNSEPNLEPMDENDSTIENTEPAAVSDLDWMRARMKSLDEGPSTRKAFHQDGLNEGEPDLTDDACTGTAFEGDSEVSSRLQTRRLFLRNLAYVCTEDDIRNEFSKFGTIEQAHIPLTAERASKGLAYVTFTDIDSAQRALKEMDRSSFQGRILHVMPAITRVGKEEADTRGSSDQIKKGLKADRAVKRKETAGRDFNWGMLYMNSDAVLSSVADRLKISKAEILDPEATNVSVRLALAETNVIEETKTFFEKQGVSLESFKTREKSDTIILVKNIPYGTTADTLQDLFSPFGDLSRVLLPPSGTIGVIEFVHSVDAGKAFKAVAYRRIKDSIVYLERGPAAMFTKPPSSKPSDPKHSPIASAVGPISVTNTPIDDSEIPPGATLFIKNLAFATTDETLNSAFRALPGFAFARVQTKPDPKRPGARLSMGFGFVGFRSVESAQMGLSGMQGAVVDGHALQVKFAKRGESDERGSAAATINSAKTTKMIVKNLPFEATKKDVRELFGAYGQLKSVRVPRKFNTQTRGFAFLDFISRREAENAYAALQHTHLLGRHLVLQWAEDGAANVELLRESVKAGWGDGTNVPGRKRKIELLDKGEGVGNTDD